MTACRVCAAPFVGVVRCTRCHEEIRPLCPACQAAYRRVAPLLCESCVEQLQRLFFADHLEGCLGRPCSCSHGRARAPRRNVMRYRVVVERPGLPPWGAILRSEAVATVAADKLRAMYPTARITVEKR